MVRVILSILKYFSLPFFFTTFPFSLRIMLPRKNFLRFFQVVLMGHDMIVFTDKTIYY